MPTIQINSVIAAIKTAAKVAGNARTPAYRTVWMRFAGSTMTIQATDSQIDYTARSPLASPVTEELLLGVEGKLLSGILDKMPAGEISISMAGDDAARVCRIQQGRRKFDLAAMANHWHSPGDPYPENPEMAFFLAGSELADVIGSVEYCVSANETLGVFASLLLDKTPDGRAVAVGLNGHQMGVRRFHAGETVSGLPDGGLKIPRRFLPDLRAWLEHKEVEAALGANRLHLRDAGRTEHWSLPLNLDPYPDWTQLLAKSGDGSQALTVHRQPLLDALERLKFFTSDESLAVWVAPEEHAVALTAQSSGRGTGNDYVPIVRTGHLEDVGLPLADLARILAQFRGEEVTMTFSGAAGPVVIREQTGDDQYEVLIMPMQMTEPALETAQEPEENREAAP